MNHSFIDNRLFFNQFLEVEEWGKVVNDRSGLGIGVLFLNIRSLGKYWDTLLTQITSSNVAFNIICLAELACEEIDLNTYISELPNYKMVSKFRSNNQKGGGLLMLYNSTVLEFIPTNVDPNITTYEHITGRFNTLGLKPSFHFTVHLIYRPPTSSSGFPIAQAVQELEKTLETVGIQDNILVLGDTNINLNMGNDINTQKYENLLAGWGLERGIWGNTREEVRLGILSETCIDHLYYRLENSVTTIFTGVIKTKISDHYPICLNFILNEKSQVLCEKKVVFNYKLLESRLKEIDWNLNDYSQVNEGYWEINRRFTQVYNQCTKSKHGDGIKRHVDKKIYNHGTKRKEWMTNDILYLIKERDKIFRQWKGDPTNIRHRNMYKNLRNRVTNLIKFRKNNFYYNAFEKNKHNPKKVWNCINGLLGRGRGNNIDLTIETAMSKHMRKSEIVNGFVNYFIQGIEEIKHVCRYTPKTNVNNLLSNDDNDYAPNYRLHIPKVSPEKVIKIIEGMDDNKSAGYDGIRTRDLKLVRYAIAKPLSELMNGSISSGVFPNTLKKAIIRPIFKNKSKKEFQNYRPIAILPTLEKILETHVAEYLNKYLDENNIISHKQFGFRKKRCTEDALLEFVCEANELLDNRGHGLALFIDFSKAFDTIEHNELVRSLYNIGVRGCYLKWFNSYLQRRKIVVKALNEYSEEKEVKYGVPQGSKLGPTLFIIFLNEILNNLNDCNMWAFADDVLLFAGHRDLKTAKLNLQNSFTQFTKWTHDKGLVINATKTCLLHIRPKNTSIKEAVIIKYHNCECLQNQSYNKIDCFCDKINLTDKTKYLGVTVDDRLTWNEHITQVQKKLNPCIAMMYNLQNKVPDKIKITVYKALFESIIKYAISSWGSAADCHIKNLTFLQRRCLKALNIQGVPLVHRENIALNNTSLMRQLAPKGWYFWSILVKFHSCDNMRIRRIARDNMRTITKYYVPTPRTEYGKRLPQYIIPRLSNMLPEEIELLQDIKAFKKVLYNWLNDYGTVIRLG